jgi:hypothetical protein
LSRDCRANVDHADCSPHQLAERWQVPKSHVYRLTREGGVPVVRLGRQAGGTLPARLTAEQRHTAQPIRRGVAWLGFLPNPSPQEAPHMHFGGHLREAFGDWVDDGMPDNAAVELNYELVSLTAEKLLGRFVHCSDIMPGDLCSQLDMRPGTTYAQAAQRLLRERRRMQREPR